MHLLFHDPSGLTAQDTTAHTYSGVVYITDETMQFNGTVVYKAKVVEYSHKAADLKNAINSDTTYLKQLKCELPSRVTLADYQTTKKLANPHKY